MAIEPNQTRTPADPNPVVKGLLQSRFAAAIAVAQPHRCIAAHLPVAPKGRLIVVGAGKASAEMAHVVELCPLELPEPPT